MYGANIHRLKISCVAYTNPIRKSIEYKAALGKTQWPFPAWCPSSGILQTYRAKMYQRFCMVSHMTRKMCAANNKKVLQVQRISDSQRGALHSFHRKKLTVKIEISKKVTIHKVQPYSKMHPNKEGRSTSSYIPRGMPVAWNTYMYEYEPSQLKWSATCQADGSPLCEPALSGQEEIKNEYSICYVLLCVFSCFPGVQLQ